MLFRSTQINQIDTNLIRAEVWDVEQGKKPVKRVAEENFIEHVVLKVPSRVSKVIIDP